MDQQTVYLLVKRLLVGESAEADLRMAPLYDRDRGVESTLHTREGEEEGRRDTLTDGARLAGDVLRVRVSTTSLSSLMDP